MSSPPKNQRQPAELSETDIEAAFARIDARDPERGEEARHVYGSLTWGEGPGAMNQSGVQDWLWYRLPTKYLTDEVGYMGRLADIAAEFFDEVGLDAYAALCRSPDTASVHAAFDRSDSDGFTTMRQAVSRSGIDPPDLEDFVWGDLMGAEEAQARAVVGEALENAISAGELSVGGRGWKVAQGDVVRRVLDSAHPLQPGQTWRTAVITERIGGWEDGARHRSEELGRLRANVAKRILHPVTAPSDVAERLAPMLWLLAEFGDEQALTQAGYLNTGFVRHVAEHRPWPVLFRETSAPRSEVDEFTLHHLRGLFEKMGVWRKKGRSLRRTVKGAKLAVDPAGAWEAVVRHLSEDPWDRFVLEVVALILVAHEDGAASSEVMDTVAGFAAEMGWRTPDDHGVHAVPSRSDASSALSNALALLKLFGMLDVSGDWRSRRWRLTPAGVVTMLGVLRSTAAGPKARPW